MSTEIVLYPTDATRDKLRKALRDLGFIRCRHLWKWPTGSIHFAWFETADYQSSDGVEATIFRPSDEDRKQFNGGGWAVHTRTRASASVFDKGKQNSTVRVLRKAYGGNFYNDWFGTNRYTPLAHESRGPAGRGISLVYESTVDKLSAVSHALPEPTFTFDPEDNFATILLGLDPARVLYNALVPFAVAAFEHFFRQSFTILLRYHEPAKLKLASSGRRVDIDDAMAISRGERTIEDVVAGWYSFQNLDSMHSAFKEWLGLDFRALLRQRRRIGGRMPRLDDQLSNMIAERHGVIHRFEFNQTLDDRQVREMMETIRVVMDVFVHHIERVRGMRIRA